MPVNNVVGNVAAFLISKVNSYMTGTTVEVSGGFNCYIWARRPIAYGADHRLPPAGPPPRGCKRTASIVDDFIGVEAR